MMIHGCMKESTPFFFLPETRNDSPKHTEKTQSHNVVWVAEVLT